MCQDEGPQPASNKELIVSSFSVRLRGWQSSRGRFISLARAASSQSDISNVSHKEYQFVVHDHCDKLQSNGMQVVTISKKF